MGMKQTLDVLNLMEADGVVSRYAIGGAVAEGAVDTSALCDVIDSHGLKETWRTLCRGTGIVDPCELRSEP
jgi:hypothetical protein